MHRSLRITFIVIFAIAALGIFAVAIFFPAFRDFAYAPLRELILPPPKPVIVNIYYSTEKSDWFDGVIDDFYKAGNTVDGKPIELEMKKMGSREMYLAVLDGEQPDAISPASSLQIAILQDLSEDKFGESIVKANQGDNCRSLVETPLVLVSWAERAQALWGAEPNSHLWQKLHSALTDPQGWASVNHPEWGYIKFGQTSPLSSNSGFMTILLLTYDFYSKTSGLRAEDILSNQEYQQWFLEFQGTISQFGNSTGTYMRDMVAYGPSTYDFVAVYEATAIEHMENASNRYGDLKVYYPPATVMSDHPLCVLDAEWVTPQKAEAVQVFTDFLLSREAQETALLDHGFRPGDTNIPLDQPGSPFLIYQGNGIQVGIPAEVEIPPGNVLDTLLNFWSRNIQR
jgi:ABC-type Fe3+ transport system substrate-binding protein